MKGIMKKILLFITTYLYAGLAYAQDLIPCPDGTYADPSIGCVTAPATTVAAESNIIDLILRIASVFMAVVAGVAVIALIFGGISYAMALGNDEKIQKAKRMIFWSVIGLVVALVARFVVQFVISTVM